MLSSYLYIYMSPFTLWGLPKVVHSPICIRPWKKLLHGSETNGPIQGKLFCWVAVLDSTMQNILSDKMNQLWPVVQQNGTIHRQGGGGVLHAWRTPQGCTGSLFVIQKNSRDDRWGWTMLSAFRETWNIKGQLRVGWQKTITMERVGNGSDWAPHSLEYLGGSRTVDRIVPLIRCGDSACHS